MKFIQSTTLAFGLGVVALGTTTQAQTTLFGDHYITGDLSVDGFLCAGLECTNNENFFGLHSLKLKDTRPSIWFEDTSPSDGTNADRQWGMAASGSSTDEQFILTDFTASTTPLTIMGGAPTNSLFVDSDGGIGLGTMFPEFNLHMVSPATAVATFETTTTAQKWYVGANTAGFFIQDSIGFTVPFIVEDGAPTHAMRLTEDGDIGLGIAGPTSALHLQRADGSAKILVDETSSTQAARELFQMKNKGGSYFTLTNTASGRDWFFTHENNASGRFIITSSTNPSQGLFLDPDGDLRIGGTLTENSDKHAKMAVVPVNAAEILGKVAELPVSSWTYKDDTSGARHVGPMAQDFYAAFGLGTTETGIATLDTSGVALASIKALHDELEDANGYIAKLEARDTAQSARIARLEALIENISESLR